MLHAPHKPVAPEEPEAWAQPQAPGGVIEDKTLTLRYNRQSTVQRSYAPQGLIRLLAQDLNGPPHFVEVDLDSPFFRLLDVQIEAPAVFEQIGLLKSDVAIEYGRPSEPATYKSGGPTHARRGSG